MYGSIVSEDTIRMRSHWIRLDASQLTVVLIMLAS